MKRRSDSPPRRGKPGRRSLRGPGRVSPPSNLGIPAVHLKSPIYQPLVYRKRLEHVDREAQAGDLVAVYAGGVLFGYGLYNPRSEIALRVLWYGETLPTDEHWQSRLRAAVALRQDVLQLETHTNAYRVVHSEADELSGLVVDKFGDVLSAETFSLGMYQRAPQLLQWLAPMCGAQHTLVQPSPSFLSQEGIAVDTVRSADFPSRSEVREYGTRFRIRYEGGHKTGFFCDQRENRRRLAQYCEGKSVLDLCCYTGGFAVQAKRLGKAADVLGVDIDAAPLKLAKENADLNQCRVRFVQSDAFAYAREMIGLERQFDVVILDPPKFIRNRGELEEGTKKHYALNRLAMQLVRPGGLLLSCSCAGLLAESEFTKLLVSASIKASDVASQGAEPTGRRLQFLEKTGAAPDHPVISTCLETEYLKAAWMIVH